MRRHLALVAALTAGAASAAGVAACGDDDKKKKGDTATRATAPTAQTTQAQTTTAAPAQPTTLQVTVDGRRQTIQIAVIGFAYCRANTRICAAIKPSQEKYLTPNQRRAVADARTRLEEINRAPEPELTPAPEPPPPSPAPEPPPPSDGGTQTG